MARRGNIVVQVLRFAAGEHLASGHGGFVLLNFKDGDPPLGYIETLGGALYIEDGQEI